MIKGKESAIWMVLACFFFLSSLYAESREHEDIPDYRREMRSFVESISAYGRKYKSDFIVIPQNGQELMTSSGESDGTPVISYLKAIDGVGREDLFYGYTGDNRKTPVKDSEYMLPFLQLAEKNNIEVLVIDYCDDHKKMDRSYDVNNRLGFVSFAADSRALDNIPAYPGAPVNENDSDVFTLSHARNFLYLINPGEFESRDHMLKEIGRTNYDLLIIDLFDNDGYALDFREIEQLKVKSNGGKRLVIAYMSIGEAEDYRYYWRNEWDTDEPLWMDEENRHWKGNYKVKYWEPSWKKIILGDDDAYLDRILESGFDGVYLDIIDAFYYFETK